MTASRSKAEERYAEIQKRERGIRQELDNATKLRLEKAAKLRQLRLAKEAEDAAENRLLRISEPRVKTPLGRRVQARSRFAGSHTGYIRAASKPFLYSTCKQLLQGKIFNNCDFF